MTMDDRHNLARFVRAQAGIHEQALAELRAGRKRSHWMWFVFPQLAGLGVSAISRYYAIQSREEAQAYFEHPLLGSRLVECTAAVLLHAGTPLHQILGMVDAVKFASSMTLFEAIAGTRQPMFGQALDTFREGERALGTLSRLD
jgi:uncharacterized protein (DUF1810 family)